MGPPPQLRLLLRAVCIASLLQLDLAAAVANERWHGASLHHDVDGITADVYPRRDEWYPGSIFPAIEAPWYSPRTGCVLAPEEERLRSSTHDVMRNEDREVESQLVPHSQRDSTGFRLQSWWGQEWPAWNTATYARFGDTSNLHSTMGDSSYGDVMALGGHSVKGASPNWLAVVDSHDQYEVSEDLNYHSFYHDPKDSAYSIPHTWYHSTPHEHGSVSHSGTLPHGSSPSDISGLSELHQIWNARKPWNTLGSISSNCGKLYHYHDSSDEQLFEDHRSLEETAEEDPDFSECTHGRPLLVLDHNDKNHYLKDGCSCTRKHGIGHHGAEVAVDTGFRNMDEELAKVACKTELAPGRVEGGTEPFDLATVPVEESYGKQKPEFEQHGTGQDGFPDDKQDQKILLLFEDFPTEAGEIPQNTETVFDGVPNDEKLDSRPDSGNQKLEYDQQNTGQDGNPGEIHDHKILILFEDFPIEGGELPQNAETVLDCIPNDEKLDSRPDTANQKPEYEKHNIGQDGNPGEIQDHKILILFEDLPIEGGALPQNAETVLDGIPNDEKLDSRPDSANQKPEYDQHNIGQDGNAGEIQDHKILVLFDDLPIEAGELPQNTETVLEGVPNDENLDSGSVSGNQIAEYDNHNIGQDGNPDEIQDHKVLVLFEDLPTEAGELPQNIETVPDGGKLESGSLDQVSERQCQKEDDNFGHYVLRCEEEIGDVKLQGNPVQSDNFSAEIDARKVAVEEHKGSEPRDEFEVIHKQKYDVLEPIGCSENLAPSDNNSFEKIESPLITEITPEQSKLDKLFTDLAPSLLVEFDGKENTVGMQQFTERQDVPATPQAHKDIILVDVPDKRDTETQAFFRAYVPVSYGKQHSLFGLHENSMRDSSQTRNTYEDSLHADNFPAEANELSWQEKVQPVEKKWNSEPFGQVSIYKDDSFGNQKWNQYAIAWKDLLEALKSSRDLTQSENFAVQTVEGPWKTEEMAHQEDWKSDSFDQVDVCVDNSHYKPETEWEYYSNKRKGKQFTSSSGQSSLFPGFAPKEAKITCKSMEEETPDSELWEKHKILYDSIKTEGYPAYVDGSDAETLDLEWGSGGRLGYESFAGTEVQSDETHGNQKVTPEDYGTEWLGPFDAIENQNPINCETFSVEAAYVPQSHKVVHENEMNRYGKFSHIGGDSDGSFRIQIPLEFYKPVNWRTVSDGTTYELHGTDNSHWDEHVQRSVPMGEEVVDRAVAIGLPAPGVIYDADTSGRRQWNFGTNHLPQKEYIPYESHDMKPTTHCNGVRKAKSRTPPARSKVGSSKKTKKWREDFEGIALPVEWPTQENFVKTREHPHTESKCCTGRKLPMGEAAVDRTVVIGLPAADVSYDADTSASGQWNFGTHQLPQKEYIPYESHDTKPTTHCNGVGKAKSRTPLARSKVGSSKKTKKWREDFEGIALPFEWPTKENFVRTREHPHAESKCCTGRKLPMGEEAVDRTVVIGLPAADVSYDADTSASGQWNFGTHQLPQKEYIPYESHDMKPTTHCNGVGKAKSHTHPSRSKVGSSKKTKKSREDFEGIALPFEWPTKENFVQTREHPHTESRCCTGRKLHSLEDSEWEVDEHSWSVDGGRMTSEEWSDASRTSSGSLEWSSSAKEASGERPGLVAPLSNMIQGLIRVFTGPFKKAANHVKNWRERKAERSRSCAKEAGFEPRTAVTVTPAPLSPSRLRANRRHRTPEARKRLRKRLTGLMGGLLMGACGGGHTTVKITMPDD